MPGRTLRLFAAAAALTFLPLAPAAAGLLDGGCCGVAPATVDWGCAPSGCAPLATSFGFGHTCCAPVRWGCGNPCGYGFGYVEAVSQPYDVMPIHVVPQGPLYSPPLTGYTYPVSRYEEESAYPYGPGSGGYYGFRSSYRHGYRSYPLRMRGQVPPETMWK